ncbi:MAG TPA: flippase [bacterium]|nr:flippase [bacterium]
MAELREESGGGANRVVANAAYLLATNAYRILLNMAIFFVIARVLGAEELGRYAFALSYATLFSVAVHLGLNDLIIRQVAVNKADGPLYFTVAVIFKLIMGVLVTAATAVTIGVSGKPTAVQELVLAAALTTSLVSGVETVVVSFFYAHERMSYVLVLGIMRVTLNAVVGIGAVLAGLGARGVLWGFLAVETVVAAFAFWWVRRRLGIRFARVAVRDFGPLLWRSLPFGLNGIFITVYMQLHFSLLSFFSGDAATGVYAAAAKLVTFLCFIPAALTQALYPYLSRLAAGEGDGPRRPAVRSIRYLALISFPAALYLFFRAGPVVSLVYGDEYAGAARLLAVLALTLPFVFATYPAAVALNAVRRERANTAVAAGAAAVNVAANLILVPFLGPLGAALAFLATESSQSIARQVLLRLFVGPLHLVRNLARVVPPVAIMGLAMYFTRPLPLYAEFPVLAAVYVAAALATRAVGPEDLATILRRNRQGK